jgi:pyruvate dehydrogenase E1 component
MAAVTPIPPQTDVDAQETQEWLDALSAVIQQEGPERAHYLIEKQIELARATGINVPYAANTAYVNSIPPDQEVRSPGNHALEDRIRSFVRWNAVAMVLKANKGDSNLGGHIASYASAATLYDVGFNHFWHAPSDKHGGDLIYMQGHSAPGFYGRAFMLGQLTAEQMDHFRREVDGKGLSSYPHPWLMPEFWQYTTVSMGLGPIQAIFQARFMKYLHARGIVNTEERKVWCFVGDGEMDEPESQGAIGLAGRENLDNLIFVVNCNLQRLDGPVRGNSKIIQELEAGFRGHGWNVIKLIWGSYWDPLLARDRMGLLRKRMEECVDGDYQTFKSRDGAFVREYFFGKYPELKELVASWSDDDIWRLNRGGHDPHKVYAAYHAAIHHKGQPTVILAKTIKGYGMGEAGEAQNITHQQKKMGTTSLQAFRNRFKLPLTDEQLENLEYIKPAKDSPEYKYMRERRDALGGDIPVRRRKAVPLEVPPLSVFESLLKASGEGREFSTTMAFVRLLGVLLKDKHLGKHIVPIVADEARTFGMEALFRSLGIWSQKGQLYTPQDKDQLMFYKEDAGGQILQEGINEAGAVCSWIAAATSYSTHGVQMIPFFIFYSMFGIQRTGDLWWAAGDSRSRGFLLGGTSGRTTLNGEGLQHEDGHSHVATAQIPNCMSYDPTFGYELAVIMHDGLRRMVQEQEDIYYYITVMNENYEHPAMSEGSEAGILKGMYRLRQGGAGNGPRVQLLGSGAILREVIAAADLLKNDWGVEADIWSCPSFTLLARDGNECARWNLLHPAKPLRFCHVGECLKDTQGPVIASTDYVRAFAEQIRPFVPRRYTVLGTDGFGRSDTREKLRYFFEVDRHWVTLASLAALAEDGAIERQKLADAIRKYGIDPEKPNPLTV